MVPLADGSGLAFRRGSAPPSPRPYPRLERGWSAWETKGKGVLRNSLKEVLPGVLGMTGKGLHPPVKRLHGAYPDGVRVPAQARKKYEAWWPGSATLPKSDITIRPREARNHR